MLRFAALAALSTALGCSSDGSRQDDPGLPPFQGTPPGSTGAPPVATGADPVAPSPGPSSTGGMPAGTAEAAGELPLQPGKPPAGDPGAASPTTSPEMPPLAEPPPVLSTATSTLPLPPGDAGQPEPSGAPGGLEVLDWAGFRSAVSYTFDDTNQTQIDRYGELMSLNVSFTFYLISGGDAGTRLANPVWAQALAAGHEIGNHTRSHRNSGEANLAEDTDDGKSDIEARLGNTVYTMAAPYGAADYVDIASTRYLINRGTNGGQVAPNDGTNPFSIPTFSPTMGAPASVFNAVVDQGRANGTWHTVLVHGFLVNGNAANGDYMPADLGQFMQAVNYAKGFGDVWIDTVVDVGSYWVAQKLFDATTPTTSGAETTWTWTLPNHFPPNRFLRVTVDGGTLKQNGAELPWNDHGFYEVALDEGSLTLSPRAR